MIEVEMMYFNPKIKAEQKLAEIPNIKKNRFQSENPIEEIKELILKINYDDRDGTNHLLEKLKPFPKKTETSFVLPYKPNSYVPAPKESLVREAFVNKLLFSGLSPNQSTNRRI